MTSLQKQLAAIAASSTHQLDLKAQKAAHSKSLLFEPKVAASQSFDSLYLLCYEGFREICALDGRFAQFARNLFSEQSKVEVEQGTGSIHHTGRPSIASEARPVGRGMGGPKISVWPASQIPCPLLTASQCARI
jgi:hypothetical protein